MINNFDVLKTMCDRNMNIRAFPASNITYVKTGKQFGSITMNVDNETATKIMNGTPIIFSLIIADVTEFDKVKKELGGD